MTGSGSATEEERSAGGVVVRYREGVPHALVIRDPYKNWGLPKGHIEPDETADQAALREVREETGLERVEIRDELGTVDWWFQQDGVRIHKYCTFFLMISPTGAPRPELGEGITDCVWLSLDEAVSRITYDNARAMVREARELLSSADGETAVGDEDG